MPEADLASRPTPEERASALAELTELIMSDRQSKHDEVMDKFRATFRPPSGEAWRSKKWIVVLSDDDRVRDQVTKILEGENYFVRAFEIANGPDGAISAMEACFYLEDGKIPDLVAADAFLAELGCLEFFRELRQRTAYSAVPMVMLVRGNDMPAVPFIFSVSDPIDRVGLLEFVQRETAK